MPPIYKDSGADAVYGGLNRDFAKIEREIARQYGDALKDIRAELERLYRKHAAEGVLTYAEMTKYNRLVGLEAQIAGILSKTDGKVRRLTKKLTAEQYEGAYFRHAYTIEKLSGASLAWGILRPDAIAAAVANPLDLIAQGTLKVNERARIRRAITQGLVKGESYQKMARAVKQAMGSSLFDALRIARTEGHRAQMQGTIAAFDKAEDLGVNVKRIWVATKDDRTRDAHRELDQEEAIERNGESGWYVGGSWATSPGAPELPPEESINCRCVVREEIAGLEPKVLRVQGGIEKHKEYMASTSYAEWKKGKGK